MALGDSQRIADGINGTVFRPDLVYNKNTQKYVLWFNWVAADGTYEGYAAYTGDTPVGPFVRETTVVPLSHNNATFHAGADHGHVHIWRTQSHATTHKRNLNRFARNYVRSYRDDDMQRSSHAPRMRACRRLPPLRRR